MIFFHFFTILHGKTFIHILINNMKRNYTSILLSTALALIAVLVSQSLWLQYAANKDIDEQKTLFQRCFDISISETINRLTGDGNRKNFYEIEPVDDAEFEEVKNKGNPIEIDAGSSSEGGNVSIMIENAFLVLFINNNSLCLTALDSLITNLLNEEDGYVVSSYITLQDTRESKIIGEVSKKYIQTNSPFFIKTYTAERKIEIPDKSYVIKAEYRIKQPSYLKRLGFISVASFITSIIIIFVLFYLLLMINRRHTEISNMERSFHGAIHDLKSPLAYVFFLLSSLEDAETDMDKKASLSLSANRVNFLTDKIKRLLSSARNIQMIEETDKIDVSLYDILEQIEMEIITMFPDKKICFEYNVDADFTMRVLPDLMEAAIRIIIENAVKYSKSEPVVKISTARNIANLKICIADNGIGMNKQQLKNIFKPYYSSDKIEGNGIGLYYAQSIVKAHRGKISVTSEANKGSTFVITLPII